MDVDAPPRQLRERPTRDVPCKTTLAHPCTDPGVSGVGALFGRVRFGFGRGTRGKRLTCGQKRIGL